MRIFVGVVVLCAAACGEDGKVNQLPDAPLFQDAPAVDAPSAGLVTLTVTNGTTPIPDVRVYFQNADSSLVASRTTDASGVATATMEPGGFVTAIDPFLAVAAPAGALVHDLRTFAGVKPGDLLVLNRRVDTTVNFTLTFTADANGVNYDLYAPCLIGPLDVTNTGGSGSSGPGGPITLTGCGTTTDLTVVAKDRNGIPISAFHNANSVLVEGGTLDLTAATFSATQDVTFTYASVPANIASINVQRFLATTRGPVFDLFESVLITGGNGMSPPRPSPFIPFTIEITASRSFGGPVSSQTVLTWGIPLPNYTLVMSNVLMPIPTILLEEFADLPAFKEVPHAIEWTVTAGGNLPDFATTSIQLNRASPLLLWTWDLAAPLSAATSTSAAFPVLPGADAMFNAVGTDTIDVVELRTAKVPGGYDAVRAKILALGDDPNGLVVGTDGAVVFQDLQTRGEKPRAKQPATRVLRPTTAKSR